MRILKHLLSMITLTQKNKERGRSARQSRREARASRMAGSHEISI